MTSHFDLLLFSVDTDYIVEAVQAGIDAIVIDWEFRGKAERQARFDTQINHNTLDDLRRVRAATAATVICRINGVHDETPREVEQALDGGADEIFLPMVRTVDEVESVLAAVNGRCGVDILIETVEALQYVDQFAQLPLRRVYVGLNDLAIQRKLDNIFISVADGTVERARRPFSDLPFGFGGLTLPQSGAPIPSRLLMGELMRLSCRLTFLRRSFLKDVPIDRLAQSVPVIRTALAQAAERSPEQVAADQAALYSLIDQKPQPPVLAL